MLQQQLHPTKVKLNFNGSLKSEILTCNDKIHTLHYEYVSPPGVKFVFTTVK
jgi:hypothetical protein